MEQQELEAYWKAQVTCVGALRQIGIEFKLRDRIPAMVIMKRIRQFWRNPASIHSIEAPGYVQAQTALAQLVYLRTLGIEPAHDRVKYLA